MTSEHQRAMAGRTVHAYKPLLDKLGLSANRLEQTFSDAVEGDRLAARALWRSVQHAQEMGAVSRLSDKESQMFIVLLMTMNDVMYRAMETVEKSSVTDLLTGLYTRRHFDKILSDHHAMLQRGGAFAEESAVILIDLGGLKSFNDRLSPTAGDMAIARTGQILNSFARQGEAVSRFGGDEFALLVTNTSGSPDFPQDTIARLQAHLDEHGYMLFGGEYRRLNFYVSSAPLTAEGGVGPAIDQAGVGLNAAKDAAKKDRSSYDVSGVDPDSVPNHVKSELNAGSGSGIGATTENPPANKL